MVAFGMLRTIHFDNQSLRLADEVSDKRPDRLLLAEFETAEAVATQCAPQLGFFGCHIAPQSLGAFQRLLRITRRHTLTLPRADARGPLPLP
ncbi:MAG: hypothetical protein A2885_01230 [Sphingopyxis sp. RIFCSPHIGHO2_01_FULL_65_24]|nr:MAG: hypothetical protein A2885_01230 [Sphingopyxis sp. RIFCSPHIGHO2_01_FULL_65_24]